MRRTVLWFTVGIKPDHLWNGYGMYTGWLLGSVGPPEIFASYFMCGRSTRLQLKLATQ